MVPKKVSVLQRLSKGASFWYPRGMKQRFLLLSVFLGAIAQVSHSFACPKVGRIPDFNCDGEARILVMGDSVVAGTGDTENDGVGGYVVRTQAKLPEATVVNLGVAGQRTFELHASIADSFSGEGDPSIAEELVKADLVVLDIGRNDRWLMGAPAETLVRLKRIRTLIARSVKKVAPESPLIVTASMMLPNRGSQGPWVKQLNELIQKTGSLTYPGDLRLDLVSKRLLSFDQIHPTSKGYKALAAVLTKYVLKTYPLHVAQLRVDEDLDGLYDIYEQSRYGTSPTSPDTDGDGLLDGEDPTPHGG